MSSWAICVFCAVLLIIQDVQSRCSILPFRGLALPRRKTQNQQSLWSKAAQVNKHLCAIAFNWNCWRHNLCSETVQVRSFVHNIAVLWGMTGSSVSGGGYQLFRLTCCPYHSYPEDGSNMPLWNVHTDLADYAVSLILIPSSEVNIHLYIVHKILLRNHNISVTVGGV
jgi:hypothetical protein